MQLIFVSSSIKQTMTDEFLEHSGESNEQAK